LASGLPALAFDLGAQGDAVRAAPTGILLPWAADRRRADQLARLIVDAFENETHREEVAASPQGAFSTGSLTMLQRATGLALADRQWRLRALIVNTLIGLAHS